MTHLCHPKTSCGTPPNVLEVVLTEHEDEDVDDTVLRVELYQDSRSGHHVVDRVAMFIVGRWVVPLEESLFHLPRQGTVTSGGVVDRVPHRVGDRVVDRVGDPIPTPLLLVKT